MEYEIIRILEGEFRAALDEKEFTAGKGDLIFINSSILHSGVPENCVYECIVFDMNAFLKHNSACKPFIQKVIDHRALIFHHFTAKETGICDTARVIFDAFREKPAGYELTVFGGFYLFLGQVFASHLYYEEAPQSLRDHKKIHQLKNVLEYIDANYQGSITLEQLSNSAHMSPKYFCRFFQEMTHRTPMDYLNYQRIEHAAFLLSTTHENVTDIAYACGFNDLSYFIKTFKRYKNVTPGQYTRQ
jgi:AraC-like DNA-binding protein